MTPTETGQEAEFSLETTPEEARPARLPVLPLRGLVFFPHTTAPVLVGRTLSLAAVQKALEGDQLLCALTQRESELDEVGPKDLYTLGCLVRITQSVKLPDGSIRLVLEGLKRVEVRELGLGAEGISAEFVPLEEIAPEAEDVELQALARAAQEAFSELADGGSSLPPEAPVAVMNAPDEGTACDLMAFYLPLKEESKQQLLAILDPKARLERVLGFLEQERQIIEAMERVRERVRKRLDSHQHEIVLREQLKAIKDELNSKEERPEEVERLEALLEKGVLPEEARTKALRELDRLENIAPMSPEYSVTLTYLDWIASLPWGKYTRDKLDLERAQRLLDEDHYGLEKVKERLLEYLAVRKLNRRLPGPILCFVGPPGTGKTSLGRSIARTLGRKFVRFSLGGVRDEAEIRGHRRTYVGALPGKILQGLRNAGSANPVFMIDEVDKLGHDWRGDPAAALLEVLDPEQNSSFRDHYLEVPFDLSKVMFLTTANRLETLPPALLDRMEVLEFEGYTEPDKLEIARRYLVPRQLKANGLKGKEPLFEKSTLETLIRDYTREAGVRNLEREIGSVCRKLARKVASGKQIPKRLTPKLVHELLGVRKYARENELRLGETGVALGLAWTETGGELLPIEVSLLPGKGEVKLTGSLGQVMKESAETALTCVKSLSKQLTGKALDLKRQDVHVHVPSGAVPKDGPSAGLALAMALVSALLKEPVRPKTAFTGEITLRGKILAVGGLKAKLLAAQREGIRRVVLPKENAETLEDLPKELRQGLELVLVKEAGEVLQEAFEGLELKV